MPLPLQLLAILALWSPVDSLAGPGVSRQLATYRAARISDVRYAISLDVTARDTARGHVGISFTRRGGGDAILDFRGLASGALRVNGRRLTGVAADGAHIRIPASALVGGANTVELDFAAAIAPAGASIIRFHDATDGADYLYTLLVPADANALFPCFDQPDLKARVTFTLRVPRGWTAVANGPVVDSTLADSAKTFRFAETRPISTYLIAFAAGPWKTATRRIGEREVTMYARASRFAEVESDSLIEANARALRWLEDYFASPYPFAKFAFVLAPAFPFGGMEHPGAVFYNEESFVYRERPTQTQRIGRTATIYHEVAHQWFGDYVTMRWFDDLWLKEGFATYMAAKMQDALDPGAQAWKTFYLRNKPAAYGVDVTVGTTPVWQALGNLDQAKSNYGAIVYNKAPGVLKQLNYLVGDSAFRMGLQAYLRAHPYGNATWRDLLGAIGTAARRDLRPWGEQYILRRGLPVLETGSSWVETGPWGSRFSRVTISQRPAKPAFGARPWPIRTRLLVLDATSADPVADVAVELRSQATTVKLPSPVASGALVYPNAGDYAYAVTLLDDASVRWVERHLDHVDDPFLRAMLWGSMWDLVRDGRYAPISYLRQVQRYLGEERDEQIVTSVLARATRAVNRYMSDAQRAGGRAVIVRGAILALSDTSRPYGIRKSYLDAWIAVADVEDFHTLGHLLDVDSLPGIPFRAPTRWAIVTQLVARGAPDAEQRLAAETKRDSTTEGRRRAFVAGAARPSAASKAEYFRRYFADSTLNEDWATASLGAFNAPRQEALTLPYLEAALDSLPWIQRNRRIFYLGSWLDAFPGGQGSSEAVSIVQDFLRRHPKLPADLRAKVLQSADELERTARIRATYATER